MQDLHDFVVSQLQAAKGHWPAIARECGISYRTMKKIADGTHQNPRVRNVELLARYFRERAAA